MTLELLTHRRLAVGLALAALASATCLAQDGGSGSSRPVVESEGSGPRRHEVELPTPSAVPAPPLRVQERLQRRLGPRGLQVVGVAVAFEAQAAARIRRYVKKAGLNFPVAIDRNLIATFAAYGARGTPYVALIDRDGQLRHLEFFRPGAVEGIAEDLLDETR